jgi:hypothetical protein
MERVEQKIEKIRKTAYRTEPKGSRSTLELCYMSGSCPDLQTERLAKIQQSRSEFENVLNHASARLQKM